MFRLGEAAFQLKMSLVQHLSQIADKPFTVIVEGNIGSGKSTFLDRCSRHTDMYCVPEPVLEWSNVCGVNLLEKLYTEPAVWAMPFQTHVTLTMLKSHLRHTNKPIKIIERSLFSARYVFVESMRSSGTLHPAMYSTLEDWFNFINIQFNIRADLIIYLKTTPAIAHQRMLLRSRMEENQVSLVYIEGLHILHEGWMQREYLLTAMPIVTLNADLPMDEMEPHYASCINSILSASSHARSNRL